MDQGRLAERTIHCLLQIHDTYSQLVVLLFLMHRPKPNGTPMEVEAFILLEVLREVLLIWEMTWRTAFGLDEVVYETHTDLLRDGFPPLPLLHQPYQEQVL